MTAQVELHTSNRKDIEGREISIYILIALKQYPLTSLLLGHDRNQCNE